MVKITKVLKAGIELLKLQRPHDPRLILYKFPEYGLSLLIYDHVKFTESDEYLYYESLVHPAMATHGYPREVLIIGGGDGLALREVLKWPVESVDVVDSDYELLNLGRKKLKDLNLNAFSDRRVKVFAVDGRVFLQGINKSYDVIIIDTIDPEVDQSIFWLFTKEFYLIARQKLKPDGVLVTRGSECGSLSFARIYKTLSSVFPVVKPYCIDIPSMGKVGFVLASNIHNPTSVTYVPPLQTKVYNLSFHMQLFSAQHNYQRDVDIITYLNPILQRYFFSEKLDDDERIIKSARVRTVVGETEGRDVIENDYMAVTNKRYLLARAEGVYSFTEAEPHNLFSAKFALLLAVVVSAIVFALTAIAGQSLLYSLFAFGLSMILLLGIEFFVIFIEKRGKIAIKTNARFHISNFYRFVGKGIIADILQGEAADDQLGELVSEKILIPLTGRGGEIKERVVIEFMKDPVTMEILSSAMKKY